MRAVTGIASGGKRSRNAYDKETTWRSGACPADYLHAHELPKLFPMRHKHKRFVSHGFNTVNLRIHIGSRFLKSMDLSTDALAFLIADSSNT